MLTKVFLAAGVAALAVAAPAYAGPHGGGGGGGGHGNGGGGGGPQGGGGGPPAFAGGGGGGGHGNGGGGPHGGGGGAPVFVGGGGGHGHGGGGPHAGGGAPTFMGGGGGHGHGGGGFAPQMRAQRQQFGGFAQQHGHGHAFAQQRGGGHAVVQQHGHGRAFAQQQARGHGGQQHGNGHAFAQQQGRGHGGQQHGNGHAFAQQQARMGGGQQLRGNRAQQQAFANRQVAPQQFGGKGGRQGAQFAGRQALNPQYVQQYVAPPAYQTLSYGNAVQVLPAPQVEQFIGQPFATVASFASPLPVGVQYLYPDTSDYYYRYGDGYLYQVDRTDNLIAALIPLLAGGYLPGQYLPAAYMDSYVPSYYGYNAFYPDYGDVCNRYYYGVIYQVDCSDGYVENVIPAYAGGYGVGQILPAAYSYYNVPYQYRDYYYNTADTGYWYAPGAIYQYDPRSSMITSVAALLSPGFTVGQPLPVGYDVYNVPYAYRAAYYDTPTAWYRYSNGYIYQVDPTTQLVTAIVASLLNNA